MQQGPDSSGRRLSGIVLLVVAVLVVAVLGRLQNPPRVDGTASAVPPAPPPSAGDCLLDRPTNQDWYEPQTLPPPLRIGSCDAPHFGEVYAMVTDPSVADPGSTCWQEDGPAPDPLGYLGYPPISDEVWFPLLNFVVVPAGPDPRQLAAGQRWVACLITVSTSTSPVPLTASLEGARQRGALPPQFGICQDGPDPMRSAGVDCAEPHRAQQFGQLSLTGPGPDRAALASACADLIAAETLAGPRTGLQPQVAAYLWPPGTGSPVEAVLPLQPGETGLAVCSLVAADGRQLDGSLLSLGDAPVPWAR